MKITTIVFIVFGLISRPLFAQEPQSDDTKPTSTSTLNRLLPYSVEEDELYLKDDLLLNANFGLSHGKDEIDITPTVQEEETTLDLWGTAQGGYFIADRFAIGLGVTVDVSFVQEENGNETTIGEFFGGPFVRWYFVDQLFLQVLGGYGLNNRKEQTGNTIRKTNFNGFYATGGLGYDIFLNESRDVALQLGADYVYRNLTNTDNEDIKFTSGKFRYRVGIVFYFF
ncbi:MAG: autotransporter outer membrane beta-barrel domain-containing protein [Cytophagales bacterium]|nr:autotransporter outer membrane beta-barrel domain-containing protein [Cytophagales bacterium]